MKKVLLLSVISVLFLSGCAERRLHTLTYDKSYDYDRLYQSALMTMNSNNFTPVSHDKAEGVIYAKDFSTLYSAASLGVFGIIPWFYTKLNYPTISLVFLKNSDTTVISVNDNVKNFSHI